jgi:Ser/Thr protein kinase RdoA (MazF antagonist)
VEKSVLKLFDERILGESARLFSQKPGNLKLISDLENLVYENNYEDRLIILRITHSSHRTLEAIRGELDWLEYLSANGVSVPQPVGSINGILIEVIDAGSSYFLVTAFQKIPGKTILDLNEFPPEIIQKWGRMLGKMHRLAKTYQPCDMSCKRTEWFENDLVCNAEKYIPNQVSILEKYRRLIKYLHKLPKNRDSYGLIHTDFTDVNFFVHNHEIAVFDFDDCEYHWFVYDVAVILFDSLPWLPHPEMEKEEFGRFFWVHFMEGYTRENTLDGYWFSQLPYFLKLREIFLYVVFHKKWDLDHLSEKQSQVIQRYKHNIENNISSLAHTALQSGTCFGKSQQNFTGEI